MVILNNVLGNEIKINCGVPRKSVLGPILCLMNINNIYNLEINGSIITYVDDTCLLLSDNH